jgi:hypothetical protein
MTSRILAPAAAAAALLAFPVSATAEPVQDLTFGVTPRKVSTKKDPKSITATVKTGTRETTPGVQPPTLSSAAIYFPAGSQYNGDLFPKCSPSSISAARSTEDCPSGSIVGSGRAAGLAPGPITQNDLKIVVVNGGKRILNLFIEGSNPLRIQSNVAGRFSGASGDFGTKLELDIPQNLQEPAPGVPVTLSLIELKVGKSIKVKGQTRGVLEIWKCNRGIWKAKGEFRFARGAAPITKNFSLTCKK